MLEHALVQYVWLGVLLYAVAHISDYYLTIVAARLHRAGMAQHIVMQGGYELTPLFQGDVAALRWWSWRFAVALLGMAGSPSAASGQPVSPPAPPAAPAAPPPP